MGLFTPTPKGETPPPPPDGGDELERQKTRLKNEGNSIADFSTKMARQIPAPGGMTAKQFEDNFVPGFETGYVAKTPETSDTPYDLATNTRPKVRILDKGDY